MSCMDFHFENRKVNIFSIQQSDNTQSISLFPDWQWSEVQNRPTCLCVQQAPKRSAIRGSAVHADA